MNRNTPLCLSWTIAAFGRFRLANPHQGDPQFLRLRRSAGELGRTVNSAAGHSARVTKGRKWVGPDWRISLFHGTHCPIDRDEFSSPQGYRGMSGYGP